MAKTWVARPLLERIAPLAAVMITMVAVGCADRVVVEPPGQYRTIRVEPRRDTDKAKRLNKVGLERLNAGEFDEAAQALTEALSADVEFGPAHNNLGKVYFKRQDFYRAAWEFEYAIKLLPNRAEPRNNLGLVLERAGELDRAVDHYRAAVALDGDLVEYRGNLARALIRRGERTPEVATLLQQIIEQDARPEWVAWAKQQARQLGF